LKKLLKLGLLFLIFGLVFAGLGAAWYFSQEPKETKTSAEAEYYYAMPDADKGPHPLHVKGG